MSRRHKYSVLVLNSQLASTGSFEQRPSSQFTFFLVKYRVGFCNLLLVGYNRREGVRALQIERGENSLNEI